MTKLIPTEEQVDIINTAKLGKNLVIKAFAGSAKTSTCVMVANALPKVSLYVAFNKSIAEEASTKFPANVECRTMHSLAYRKIVTPQMRPRLQGYFDLKELDYSYIQYLDGEARLEAKLQAVEIVKLFCQSAAEDIVKFGSSAGYERVPVSLAELFWEDLVKPGSKLKITHDVYLKMFQLSNPVLPYKVIYLDEAQDSNPVTLDIVLKQNAQVILVGDEYQSIYEWRGAVNAMESLPDNFVTKYLTTSFRFTQDIADKATSLISIAGNTKPIIGKGVCTGAKPTKAIIVRTNSTLLEELLNAERAGQKVYVLADLKELWGKLYHIQAVTFNDKPRFPDKELSQYKTYVELTKAGDSIPELKKLLNLARTLSAGGLTANINKIKSVIVDKESKADFTLTTAHKSKGLEWDEVLITPDMFYLKKDQSMIDALLENQSLNLLYVAITRAKYIVSLPELVEEVIDRSEYLARSFEQK